MNRARLAPLARAVWVLLTVGGSLLPALALAAPAKPDTVSLRFGWPVGLTAHLEFQASRVRRQQGRTDSSGMRSRCRMRVLEHSEGRLVRIDDYELVGGPARDSTALLQQLAQHAATLTPSYIVDPEGAFVRLEDPARVKAAADSLIDDLLAGHDSAMSDQVRAMVSGLLTEEALTASVAQQWNALVGFWTGSDLELAEAYEVESEEPLPLLPGAKLPMTTRFEVAERRACARGSGGRRCVLLKLETVPDPERTTAVVRDLVKRLAGDQAQQAQIEAAITGMQVRNTIVVIAEPGTLVPYRVEHVKRVTARDAKSPGGQASQVDRRTWTFVYP